MQHRDLIVLKKVIDEINVAEEMLKDVQLEDFLNDEVLKRAVSMTIINIGELIKNVTEETRKIQGCKLERCGRNERYYSA